MRRGIVLLLGATLACAKAEPPPPPPPPAVDTAGVTQAATDLWNRFVTADTADNADGLVALFADDVRVDLQGAPPMLGKAAFEATYRPMIAPRNYTDARINAHTTLVVSNDLVLQGGVYAETYEEKKKVSTEYGRFATSLVRGADGQWRIAYLMGIIDSTVARR